MLMYSSASHKASALIDNDPRGLYRYSSNEEGVKALSFDPADPNGLPTVAYSKDNMCLFVAILFSLGENERFAWIGGKDKAICPSLFFIQRTGDKRKSGGWTDQDIHRYLKILGSCNLLEKFTFRRVRSFQTFLGQFYFPLGRIFTSASRGTSFIIQAYSLPKPEIRKYREALFEKRAYLKRQGCSSNRIMRLLEAYSYNTDDKGKWCPCFLFFIYEQLLCC